ncbi:copine [Anaeramoeba ignava]|uniref:Copine-3 n=1 Tax=Anaeramoeba ignava TaxID=1746090 RepID=A0A9Q0LI80_ANAIG|nr:copine [Anaeramoeba ignava]|eukprot:Anaeramoba_ignava/a219933_433.p1 GENE.a219933_433~~a219933_433.p1  ORF type:complete len:601 (+),score=143.68 a219933_433:44-1846(+)
MQQNAQFEFADDGYFSKVEIHVSCTKLVDLDTFTKSDPMVVIFTPAPGQRGRWMEHDRTEIVWNDLNPRFVKAITMDYHFEENQPLKFVVYHVVSEKKPLSQQRVIGEAECMLSQLVSARTGAFTKDLTHPSKPNQSRGKINIFCEEVRAMSYIAKFRFCAKKLDKKDFFGKSDPFLVISKCREGNVYVPVHQTEFYKRTLNPTWKPFSITVQKLCNGDFDRPLNLEVYDWNRNSAADFIGTAKTSLRELHEGNKRTFDLINPEKKRKKRKYKNSGVLHLLHCELIQEYSFLDYIAGGCDISLIVAIDFTASNGNPQMPNSLHYMGNPYEPNEYVKAITAVGEILAYYDSDKMFPVYGFGAKIPPRGDVSHCFPLNFNWENAEVQGVGGILQSYQFALQQVRLHGPTIFANIIRVAAQFASQQVTQQNQRFFILLIITDGVINDMEATIDEIVRASVLPLAIVIVGVGNADFSNMDVLDADDVPLKSSWGETMHRDIVNFIPFSEYKNKPVSELAKATLEEIPLQLTSFFKMKGIVPNQRPQMQQVQQMQTNQQMPNQQMPNQPMQPNQQVQQIPPPNQQMTNQQPQHQSFYQPPPNQNN